MILDRNPERVYNKNDETFLDIPYFPYVVNFFVKVSPKLVIYNNYSVNVIVFTFLYLLFGLLFKLV